MNFEIQLLSILQITLIYTATTSKLNYFVHLLRQDHKHTCTWKTMGSMKKKYILFFNLTHIFRLLKGKEIQNSLYQLLFIMFPAEFVVKKDACFC